MITKEYERTATRLLRGMPKSKPYFKMIDGIRHYGHKGTHKTKQAIKWQMFWRLKRFTRGKSF
jgi:hypothetical protein